MYKPSVEIKDWAKNGFGLNDVAHNYISSVISR